MSIAAAAASRAARLAWARAERYGMTKVDARDFRDAERGKAMGRWVEHLRGQWAGVLALFLVLTGGTAVALEGRNSVDSGDVVNGAIRSPDIKNGDVEPTDLSPTTPEVLSNSVSLPEGARQKVLEIPGWGDLIAFCMLDEDEAAGAALFSFEAKPAAVIQNVAWVTRDDDGPGPPWVVNAVRVGQGSGEFVVHRPPQPGHRDSFVYVWARSFHEKPPIDPKQRCYITAEAMGTTGAR